MKSLVTGGGGFLGKQLISLLLAQGDEVRSLSRSHYTDLNAWQVEQVTGDIADPATVGRAIEGCDRVFHVAAKAGVWGPLVDYQRTNVEGTRNVVDACRRHAVGQLIYTSSPSVVFSGHDMAGVDETIPYPRGYHANYPRTKAAAEQLVLAANSSDLTTVALRPHLIWGPRDNHLVPRIIQRGRAGGLRRVGRRNCLVDTVYIDNAARAHLLAAQDLHAQSPQAGKAYFIANDEPLPLWDLINAILASADLPAVTRTIPTSLAYGIGSLLELVYRLGRLPGEPRMTRFVARELATAHWFDLSAAKRDFNYHPEVSVAQGLQQLRQWLQAHPDVYR